MKITLESTKKLTTWRGAAVRVWEGKDDEGRKIYCIIPGIALMENDSSIDDYLNKKLRQGPHIEPSDQVKNLPNHMWL